jgi:hypothetical protein
MVRNLNVAEGTTIVLNENPPADLAENLQNIRIRTLNDLVENGVINSTTTLNQLLDAAKTATADALGRRETFTPFVPIYGTSRPDLRRFGSFLAAVPTIQSSESEIFWRVARSINPQALHTIDINTDLSRVVLTPGTLERLSDIAKYYFQDVVVEPYGVLTLGSTVKVLQCRDLLIKKTGRIVVNGGGAKIVAYSIQGQH